MTDMEINGTILNILKEYYTDNVACVKIGNEVLDLIEIQKALGKVAVFLQMYLIFIWKKTLGHWKKSCQGMGVPIENKYLFSLNYADDQAILAKVSDDLEFISIRLNKAYKEGGLTINLNETEFITFNIDQEFHISIEENVTIKQVQNF